ncbi:effector-associated constant component EACC1 [Streptomyces sp. HUAS TT20]|uniref:effector-associated constant component EACC1 n=1 Tax=Streptomyces sp. HUAS TT20 TaxID=3447509 RepID=UPI0021D80143|nr:hypothetical protein [Streptomyces sp. HUAS 15-9]UXY28596.1 hypothetical protein N8I87_19885 [Streptomyces sp. HUAS 15-9]
MDVLLSVEADRADEVLAELQEWLCQEADFRGLVMPMPQEPKPGELGSITEVLSVAVGGGGVLSILAASLKTYFTQPRRSDVRIKIRSSDGRSVEIDAKRVKDVEALVLGTLGQAR